jgi:ferredoxin
MSAIEQSAAPASSGFVIGIIPGRCMGNGNCVTAAEKHFDQDERDGRVVVKQPAVSQDELETVRGALSLCPVGAIGLVPDTD